MPWKMPMRALRVLLFLVIPLASDAHAGGQQFHLSMEFVVAGEERLPFEVVMGEQDSADMSVANPDLPDGRRRVLVRTTGWDDEREVLTLRVIYLEQKVSLVTGDPEEDISGSERSEEHQSAMLNRDCCSVPCSDGSGQVMTRCASGGCCACGVCCIPNRPLVHRLPGRAAPTPAERRTAVRIIARIEDPEVIKKIRDHLDKKTTESPAWLPPFRAPPHRGAGTSQRKGALYDQYVNP
jgi:hypothetical protein